MPIRVEVRKGSRWQVGPVQERTHSVAGLGRERGGFINGPAEQGAFVGKVHQFRQVFSHTSTERRQVAAGELGDGTLGAHPQGVRLTGDAVGDREGFIQVGDRGRKLGFAAVGSLPDQGETVGNRNSVWVVAPGEVEGGVRTVRSGKIQAGQAFIVRRFCTVVQSRFPGLTKNNIYAQLLPVQRTDGAQGNEVSTAICRVQIGG